MIALPDIDSTDILQLDGDDRTVAQVLRQASRDQSRPGLIVTTRETGPVMDMAAYREWTATLLRYEQPLIHVATGPLGPRGIALMLSAHVTLLSPDARLAPGWQTLDGLPALLHRRFGAKASGILFGALDLMDCAIAEGVATPDAAAVQLCLDRFHSAEERSLWRRNAVALRAAQELPFSEAFEFGCSFPQTKEAQ